VSEHGEAERALAARERQQAAVAELGLSALQSVDLAALMEQAVSLLAQGLGVEYAKVLELLPGENALVVRAGVGWRAGLVGRATVAAGWDSQAGYTLLSKAPVIVEDLRAESRFRGMPLLHEHGVVSGLSVVIEGRDRPYGVLGAHTSRRERFTEDDIHFLQAVATLLSTALERERAQEERERLLRDERKARQAAERTRWRASFLAQAGTLLGGSLDYEQTLAHVATLAVPYLADWCALAMVEEDGSIRQLALAHADPGRTAFGWELQRRYPPDPAASSGIAEVIRTGRPELMPEITDPMLEAAARDEEHLRILRGLGLSSGMVVPLRARGDTLGALTLVRSQSGDPYDEDDLSLAQELADRCALAVDNARLHDGERRERAFSTAVLDNAGSLVVVLDRDGRIVRFNRACERTTGYTAAEVRGRPIWEAVLPAEEAERARAKFAAVTEGQVSERHWCTKGGELRLIEWTATALTDDGGERAFVIGTGTDITERRRAENALRHAEERFRAAFEGAPIGVALVGVERDCVGRWLQVNPALCELTGYASEELLATSLEAITHPDDQDLSATAMQGLIAGETPQLRLETRYMHRAGHPIWALLHASVVRDGAGQPLYAIAQVLDITERKRFEGQLQHLADHDPLTGLVNRRRLEVELRNGVALAKRYGHAGALLVIDLDNFKYVNDTYGHAVGDELICRVGGVLRERLRETDVLARLGGDEFAVMLPRASLADAQAVAADLLGLIRSQACVLVGERRVRLSGSVGVAPIDPRAELTADELLVEADLAMYEAKETGRDRVAPVDVSDQQARMSARLSWSERIRDALEHDGFVTFQQPILDLRTGTVGRHELLLRMEGEGGDLIPPGAFLYVAERFGQIQAIDRWVIARAVEILAERRGAGLELALEVNLSGASITDEAVLEFVASEVENAAIDPSKLIFEVTETAAIVNVERARHFAERLAEFGCKFALDDFGAGFGSFYYLKHLPFDCLKIDGDFIRKLPTSVPDQLTVKAIVEIARGLGKETIAEFVEDELTLGLLREYGVDFAQGYHVGPPAPVDGRWPRVGG
jgi:diguanylate cyclase (GGDEF)-like protein/PAS domain S-box-containing protein